MKIKECCALQIMVAMLQRLRRSGRDRKKTAVPIILAR
jgi:hypothetical protein